MKISATVTNSFNYHVAVVQTNESAQQISISSKPVGYGSAVNGGELLMLALGTCYCNDLYREAAKRNISITRVEVQVHGTFGSEGEPGHGFEYKAKVFSSASDDVIKELIRHTDTVAEIQNTLRKGVSVKLITD